MRIATRARIRRWSGVGNATAERAHHLGIRTGEEPSGEVHSKRAESRRPEGLVGWDATHPLVREGGMR